MKICCGGSGQTLASR